MLVLTRSANQSIVIGHDIVLTVLEVRGDQVRIGIDAPREVQVHRMEVWQALQEANRQAATGEQATGEEAASLDALHRLATARQAPPAPGAAPERP